MRSIFYPLVIVLISSLFFSSCKKDTTENPVNIKIGGLLSLTGNWSSLGITSQEAMNLAASDINSYMEKTNSPYRFSTVIYDTKLDTAEVLTALNDALSKNIKFIIGPQSSAELGAIRNFANTNQILIVSQGSTAGSLAIADDALFRFCPDDGVEGKALAKTIYASGRQSLITLARDDSGNKGLQLAVGSEFTKLGGTVDAIAPYSVNTTDFAAIVTTIKSKIQQHTITVGAGKVAVYLASFDECVDLFNLAAQDPVLSSVSWYGGNGVALSQALISDTDAAAFAAKIHFFAPIFGLPQQANPNLAAIEAAIKSKTGMDADAYALSAYDAMWVIARTIEASPSALTEFEKLKTVFVKESSQYYGITGPVVLNAAGDRSIGTFDYWGIVTDKGVTIWKWIGSSM